MFPIQYTGTAYPPANPPGRHQPFRISYRLFLFIDTILQHPRFQVNTKKINIFVGAKSPACRVEVLTKTGFCPNYRDLIPNVAQPPPAGNSALCRGKPVCLPLFFRPERPAYHSPAKLAGKRGNTTPFFALKACPECIRSVFPVYTEENLSEITK